MKKFLIIIFSLLCIQRVLAGCIRAGEITYSWVSGYTFEIILKLYTDPPCNIPFPVVTSLGDTLSLTNSTYIFDSSFICKTYTGLKNFVAPGTYIISIELPNRPYGIINIPGSINIPFFIDSKITINPFLGANNSVVFNNPAIVKGSLNNVLTYNPMASDPDGDSLAYKLTACRGAGGLPIPNYSYPMANNVFSIDSITGDIYWDSPYMMGEYSIAMIIEEWRDGIMIGYITREIQFVIDLTGSIGKFDFDFNTFNIFPNPCHDYFIVRSNQQDNKSFTIQLFDIRGKLNLQKEVIKGQEIYLDNLPDGIYFINLITDQEILNYIIIKQ